MRTDEWQAHIAGITERIDDDLPRLLMADHLEEEGYTDRANLIRWQIELTNLTTEAAEFEMDEQPDHPRPSESWNDFDMRLIDYNERCNTLIRNVYDLLDSKKCERWCWEEITFPAGIKVGGARRWLCYDGIYDHHQGYQAGTNRYTPRAKVTGPAHMQWKWMRGFVEELHITERDCMDHLRKMVLFLPIRSITLYRGGPPNAIHTHYPLFTLDTIKGEITSVRHWSERAAIWERHDIWNDM